MASKRGVRVTAGALFLIIAVASFSACSGPGQGAAPLLTPWPSVPPVTSTPTGSGVGINPAGLPTPLPTPNSFPYKNQGVYEGCALKSGDVCLQRLQAISQAGFTLVLNYSQLYGSVGTQLAYAQFAQELGIKIIWNLDYESLRDQGDIRQIFPDLSATCNCTDAAGFVSYVVNLVKSLPATWGYYIGDEVPQSEWARLKAFTDYVKSLDPSHPRLIVQASGSAYGVDQNLGPVVNTADVLGVDYYPVGNGDPVSTTGSIAKEVQALARQNGKESAMVLQSFSWSQYRGQSCSPAPDCTRYPTVSEMRQMLDLTLKNSHPALILWYSYYNILETNNASQYWENLQQAARG